MYVPYSQNQGCKTGDGCGTGDDNFIYTEYEKKRKKINIVFSNLKFENLNEITYYDYLFDSPYNQTQFYGFICFFIFST